MRKGGRILAGRKLLFMKFFHCIKFNLSHSTYFLSNTLRLLLSDIYFMKANTVLNDFPKSLSASVWSDPRKQVNALLFSQLAPKFLVSKNFLAKENVFVHHLEQETWPLAIGGSRSLRHNREKKKKNFIENMKLRQHYLGVLMKGKSKRKKNSKQRKIEAKEFF